MVSAAVTQKNMSDSIFEHFVLNAVFCTKLSKMLNHARKLKVEEHLTDSAAPNAGALNWTINQPGNLAEALVECLAAAAAVKDNPGKEKVPFENQFDVDVPSSFLSLRDLGEVSAKVIEERSQHYFASYGLSSTHPIQYKGFIQQVGTKLNVQFDITVSLHEKAVDADCNSAFGTTDVDQATRDRPERLVLYYNKRGLRGYTYPELDQVGKWRVRGKSSSRAPFH